MLRKEEERKKVYGNLMGRRERKKRDLMDERERMRKEI